MNDLVLIEYSNSVDFGDILYHNGFENRVYLNADVSKPTYELEEEGTEDADGEFSPTFQKWAKKYSIQFYAQEFLADALTLMTLHDQVYVTLKNGENSQVLDIDVEPVWDNNIECWAEVTMTFVTDYIIRKNCDENFGIGCIDTVYTSGYAPQDADDGSTGQANWNTPIGSGGIMFFYTTLTNGQYYGTNDIPVGFYQSDGGSWTLLDMSNGSFGDTTLTDCVYLVKMGIVYSKMPYIYSVTDNGNGTATIYMTPTGLSNQFLQAQYDDGGWTDIGDPQYESAFVSGVTVTTGAGTFDFRLQWYNHSCTYGTGNEVNQTITVSP